MSNLNKKNTIEKESSNDETIIVKRSDLEATIAKTLTDVNNEIKELKSSINLSGDKSKKLEKLEGTEKTANFYRALARQDEYALKAFNDERAKALNEGTDSKGGYLVPEEFESDVIAYMNNHSQIRRNSTVLTMSSNIKHLNTLLADPTVNIVGEATQIPASDPTFGNAVLTAKKYAGITVMSTEVDEDAEVNLRGFLAQRYGLKFIEKEQTEFIDGVTTGSEGLRQVTGTTNIVMSAGNTTGLGISWDNLLDMKTALQAISTDEAINGKFYISPAFWAAVSKSKGQDGHYMQGMNLSATASTPLSAWGQEAVLVNQLPTTSSASTKFVLYADLKNHAFIGDRRGLRTSIMTEGTVGGVNLGETDQIAIKLTKRTAFVTALQNGLVWLTTSAS